MEKEKNVLLKNFKCFLVLAFASSLLALSSLQMTAFAKELIPCGEVVGICIASNGVYVIDTAEFEGVDGVSSSPAADAGICAGDILVSMNGKSITSADTLAKLTDEMGDSPIEVMLNRNGDEKSLTVNVKRSADGHFRMGVWIKDCESGIGTMTYVDPETQGFGALGHGICDSGGKTAQIRDGDVLKADVTSVRRGERGSPGELCGVFSQEADILGEVDVNCDFGVFGTVKQGKFSGETTETAEREEVVEGEAVILSNFDGGQIAEYSAEITKINKDENDSKGMIIKITDSRLIEKTGGIVQGMSGSPIIQNGKLVGAVTHVFVNDPTRGYGIFIANMLDKAESEA